ncbi:MAG TPA: hypothetical protein GXZ82_14885 [Firmicutes bacterium]|jgi:hypothetical protein|nr:hypothetical protein [Bacillota bacterium]
MLINMPATLTEQNPKAETATIEALFEQLLATERTTPEFLTLWQTIDQYLDNAIAKERTGE